MPLYNEFANLQVQDTVLKQDSPHILHQPQIQDLQATFISDHLGTLSSLI